MKEVDYQKLSEQYASFLVAVGGVSITVLALVLSLGDSPRQDWTEYLVAALLVATVSCFIGAQMMAETSASIIYYRGMERVPKPISDTPTGERLFLLASTNIFISVLLVAFASMLLPSMSGKVTPNNFKLVTISIFGLVLIGALIWLILAARYRIPVTDGRYIVVFVIRTGVWWGLFLSFLSYVWLLGVVFISITFFSAASLIYFAWTFKDGDKANSEDILFFSTSVLLSYISLATVGIKAIFP